MRRALIVLMCLAASPAFGQRAPTLDGTPPLVIAHRGASGYLPEHTLEAYALAIVQGADFIEPDLVSTKDGVLIARHEPYLSDTTDVAARPEFVSRRSMRLLDGVPRLDWWAADFTLAEIRALRATQAMRDRDASHNGKYGVPTFDEIVALAKRESAARGRVIGVYPETKHPIFHQSIGLPLEDALLAILAREKWTEKSSPVIIQSFETANLKALRARTNVRLVQLIGGAGLDAAGAVRPAPPFDFVVHGDARTYRDLLTDAGLAELRRYADGIGVWKPYVISSRQELRDGKPLDLNGDGAIDGRDRISLPPSDLVTRAHAAGLFVHAWTFRSDARWLTHDVRNHPAAEYRAFFATGIDGLFSDFPNHAAAAR